MEELLSGQADGVDVLAYSDLPLKHDQGDVVEQGDAVVLRVDVHFADFVILLNRSCTG